MGDNRLFNVNGEGDQFLLRTLELAFAQAGAKTCEYWSIRQEFGFLLHEFQSAEAMRLPSAIDAAGLLPFILSWLRSPSSNQVALEHWESDLEHDGSNTRGWRVYVEDWGHVGGISVICAIKPAFIWHGK